MMLLENRIEDLEQQKLNRKYVTKALNKKGWYKIANLGTIIGAGKAFILSLSTRYNTLSNCSYLLSINVVHNNVKICNLSSLLNVSVIPKIRVIKDANDIAYLEIFYDASSLNYVYAEIINDYDTVAMIDYEEVQTDETIVSELDLQAELNVSSLLKNSWEIHANTGCQIFKQNNVVHVQLCIKNGTVKNILILPEGWRPNKLMYIPCSSNNPNISGYVSVSPEGILSVPESLVGAMLFINFTFYTN